MNASGKAALAALGLAVALCAPARAQEAKAAEGAAGKEAPSEAAKAGLVRVRLEALAKPGETLTIRGEGFEMTVRAPTLEEQAKAGEEGAKADAARPLSEAEQREVGEREAKEAAKAAAAEAKARAARARQEAAGRERLSMAKARGRCSGRVMGTQWALLRPEYRKLAEEGGERIDRLRAGVSACREVMAQIDEKMGPAGGMPKSGWSEAESAAAADEQAKAFKEVMAESRRQVRPAK